VRKTRLVLLHANDRGLNAPGTTHSGVGEGQLDGIYSWRNGLDAFRVNETVKS